MPGLRSTVPSAYTRRVTSSHTRWSLIRGAADGSEAARSEFVRRYDGVVRAYLRTRWQSTPMSDEVDDAVQQVFLDLFRDDGALSRAETGRESGFRGFLFGVVRNVARAAERRRARARERQPISRLDLASIESREPACEDALDRAWARTLLRDAAELQLERARELGEDALRRHELLGLRYGEDLPVREIAARLGVEAERLHRELPKAREEFRRALLDLVKDLHGGTPAEAERACASMFDMFS